MTTTALHGHACPICHALTGASGVTYHAPLCPNGVGHALSWGTTDVTPDDARIMRAERTEGE